MHTDKQTDKQINAAKTYTSWRRSTTIIITVLTIRNIGIYSNNNNDDDNNNNYKKKKTTNNLSIYIPWRSPSLGGSRQHKRNNKNNRVSLRSSINDEGSSRVWMALLEQHSPSLPVFHNLRRFHRCRLPYCPYHRAASTGTRGNSRCQSELRHNHSPLIPIPSTLTCLPYIHPPIIQGSLDSIHPPKPRPPSSISPVNFCIHYLFQ